jgi:DNA-binding transcriptional ArsR family regulator
MVVIRRKITSERVKGYRMTFQPADSIILDTLEALRVYFDPMRMQIVQEMANAPRTVQEIAEALDVPFTRLYYHIKMLEKHHIIQVVETRSMSGAVEEKYYQAAAKQYLVDRSLLTVVPNTEENPALEAVLHTIWDETRTDIVNSVRAGTINLAETSPHPDSLMIRRGILRLSREQAAQLHADLNALFMRYLEHDANRNDVYYAVAFGLYPTALPFAKGEEEEE